MPIIPNLSDIPELKPVENGEYDLRIIKAKTSTSKRTGRNGALLIIDIMDEENAPNIMHTLWFGNDGQYTDDDEDKSNMMWRMVKEFLTAIGMDADGDIEPDAFIGVEFSAALRYLDGMETDEDGNTFRLMNPKNEIIRVT